MNLVAGMQHWCGVVPEAFAAAFLQGPLVESDDESADEGAELGAPVDQTKVWRRLARKRQKKAAHFLTDKRSQWSTLLWSVLTAPVMTVHYKLFKRGTWHSERPEVENQSAPAAASFRSVASAASLELCDLLLETADTVQVPAWIPLVGLYGPVLTWRAERLRTTRRCLLTILGQLWRKLLEPWGRYPWPLAELPALSPELQQEKARQFFGERDCCLDNFSLQLKELIQNEETLLGTECLEFLTAVFDRVVPTSTFIERAFARLSRWCDRKGPKPQLSTLAAKHTTYHFRNLTNQWRAKCHKANLIPKPRSGKARPTWSYGARKGKGLNGVHMFAKASGLNPKTGLLTQWRFLGSGDRKRYAQLAIAENVQAKAVRSLTDAHRADADALRGGFWDISAPSGFPLAKEVVTEGLASLRQTAAEFTSFSRSLRPESPDSMDGAPLLRAPLWPVCRPDSCPHRLTPQVFAYFQRLHAFFLEVILRKGPKPTALSEEPLVLEFSSPTALPCYVAVAYSTRKKPIQAALLELKELDDDSAPPDICQVLACEKSLDGHLTLKSDVQVCVDCATKAEDWRISVLGVGPVRRLSHFDIL